MAERRMLISLAHPDDESFGLGGLIAKYVAEGVDVYYLCATNGERGTVKPELLNGYASIAELRLAELECASQKLGFKKVFKLGYKDSGMMNSADNQDAECLWQAPQEQVTRRVVEVIRDIQPQVVITFNRYGGYGHPDHIAIQRATVEAFSKAGDATYLTDGQSPYQPQKLYYNSIGTLLLRFGIAYTRLRGKDPRKLGVNHDFDMMAVLDHIEPTHTEVNISAYYEAWDEASECHRSQLGGGSLRMIPMWLRRTLSPRQGFTRVFPAPGADRVDESDLYDGVSLTQARPEPER